MNEKNSILNKYYRHKYEDDVSYLKTNGLKTHYVPGGLKLNSEYLQVTDRNFSQLAISVSDGSINKKLTFKTWVKKSQLSVRDKNYSGKLKNH